jgi:head-tail adaptor
MVGASIVEATPPPIPDPVPAEMLTGVTLRLPAGDVVVLLDAPGPACCFDPAFKDILVLEPFVSQNGKGDTTYGPGILVMGRLEAEVSKRTNAPNEEQASYSTIYLKPVTPLGSPITPGPCDRLAVADGFTLRHFPIVAVKCLDDEKGVHHYRVRVLTQESALRREITLQRPVKVQDPVTGEEIITFIDVVSLEADVRPVSGEETFDEFQHQAWGVASFRTAFFTHEGRVPTPEWRIVRDGRAYDVLDVRELGQREGLEFIGKGRAE